MLGHFFQILDDGQVLGATALALAAGDAVRRFTKFLCKLQIFSDR